MKTYKDLLVWQKAMSFVTRIYETTRSFPKEEIYGLTSQVRRSAISIPSNIAEGFGRNSNKEFIYKIFTNFNGLNIRNPNSTGNLCKSGIFETE